MTRHQEFDSIHAMAAGRCPKDPPPGIARNRCHGGRAIPGGSGWQERTLAWPGFGWLGLRLDVSFLRSADDVRKAGVPGQGNVACGGRQLLVRLARWYGPGVRVIVVPAPAVVWQGRRAPGETCGRH